MMKMTMTGANENSSSLVTIEDGQINLIAFLNGLDISSFSSTLQLIVHNLNGKNYLEWT